MKSLFHLGLLVWLSITCELSAQIKESKDYALFFACNDYQNERKLSNPISNTQKIAAILQDDYGFEVEVVKNPSLAEIESKLETYKESFQRGKREEEGQLLIFFSGHGSIENNVGFFLPIDAQPGRLRSSALDYPYWRNFIDGIPCKHILVGVDACFSVRFDPNWNDRSDTKYKRPGELSDWEKLLKGHQKTTSRIFFTSDGNEKETPDKSTFAKKFLEGLMTGGGEDGILTSTELYAQVEQARPSPHCSEFGQDEPGSSFLFIKKKVDISDTKAELAAWSAAKKKNTIPAYQAFLTTYGKGDFAGLARENVSTLEVLAQKKRESDAWQQAQQSGSVAAYQDFIQRFPRSKQSREAKEEISRLEVEAARKRDEDAFATAKRLGNYQTYLDRFPNGVFRQEALAAITEQEVEAQLEKDILAWQKTKEQNTESAYRKYLTDFPGGNYKEVARAKVGTFTEIPPGDQKFLDLPNAPRMIFFKGGTFQMGSNEGDGDEKPIHSVTVSDFYLAETEVTNAQFAAFLNAKGNQVEGGGSWYNTEGSGLSGYAKPYIKKNSQGTWVVDEGKESYPVNYVSWYGAVAYCKWLGSDYRLPTEAEWEYAAGNAAKHSKYSWGDGNPTTYKGGNLRDESYKKINTNYIWEGYNDGYVGLSPVGQFGANELGLYDMSGSLWEWCSDWYGRKYYASSPELNPQGPTDGSNRVIRGGSWYNYPSSLRVAFRSYYSPSYGSFILGFRPARIP